MQLLDEHFAAMRKEANDGVSDSEVNIDEDDQGGWSDWEVESDSSEASSGWEDVSDGGGDDFEVSDSEDEKEGKKEKKDLKGKGKAKVVKKTQVEEEEEGEDQEAGENEDETKSVVSAAPTDMSLATKKLSLLAQQKVSKPYQLVSPS